MNKSLKGAVIKMPCSECGKENKIDARLMWKMIKEFRKQ